MTLADLHTVLQVAMGWEDCHLHQFHIAGKIYGIDDGEGWGPAPIDERRTRLDQVAREATTFIYEYDFGDSWEHDIAVEAVLDADNDTTYPACVAGERACPPEDCGGVWGYEQLLAAVADPDHDDHDHFLEWWATTSTRRASISPPSTVCCSLSAGAERIRTPVRPAGARPPSVGRTA